MSAEAMAAQNEVGAEEGTSLQGAKARVPQDVPFNFAGYTVNIPLTFLIAPVLVHRLDGAPPSEQYGRT